MFLTVILIRIEPQWNVNIKGGSIRKFRHNIRIEPQWNVNVIYGFSVSNADDQNRTIVECKSGYHQINSVLSIHQNRTIVECKLERVLPQPKQLYIRIEPQWNVNTVKQTALLILVLYQNRTIVECKSNLFCNENLFNKIRIEPQWNVNCIYSSTI